MPVESCTQALSDVALSFGEDDEQEESRMVIVVWHRIMRVAMSVPVIGRWLAGCSAALHKPRCQALPSSASCSEVLAAAIAAAGTFNRDNEIRNRLIEMVCCRVGHLE